MTEYIVTVKKDVDWTELHNQMISTHGTDHIPHRAVEVTDEKPHNKRNTVYNLSQEEVVALRQDSRIEAVELRPSARDDIELVQFGTRDGTTDWDANIDIDYDNDIQWGLFASHATGATNQVFNGSAKQDASFGYSLAGAGVDFVLHDSGITPDHPEFADREGNSRVQQINWYTESGIPGSQDPLHYTDMAGHGTHVAGTVAGRYQGWAPEAKIYSLKVRGLEGFSGGGYGIEIEDCFDVVRLWHRNKPIDPVTGYKRPTIVNMSWGYMSTYVNSMYGEHEGVAWDDSSNPGTYREEYGMLRRSSSFFNYRHPVHVASVDADIQEMIAEGIIIVSSAGNNYHRSYRPGGQGYDNWYSGDYWVNKFNNGEISDHKRYYHRGSSPTYNPGVIIVGNAQAYEQPNGNVAIVKAVSSTTGPGVDVWAPGTQILSSVETQRNTENSERYGPYDLAKYSGTSMASPQVCGYLATVLGMRPWLTPEKCLGVIQTSLRENEIEGVTDHSDSGAFDGGTEGTLANYTNYRSGQGAPNRFLVTPYSNQERAVNTTAFRGGVELK